MKLLYFDVETTGLNPVKNDIIQFACIVEIDEEIKEEYQIKIKPFDFTTITTEALETNGLKLEDLYTFEQPKIAFIAIQNVFAKYINRMDKTDKFTPVAYNGKFDLDFMQTFFKKNGSNYFGAWQNWQLLDPLVLFRYYCYKNNITHLSNHKLETVCNYFGITFKAHDAMEDVKAMRKLHKILCNSLFVDKPTNDELEEAYEDYIKENTNE